jgi:hypothetical protein
MPLPCTPELRTAIRFAAGFAAGLGVDFAAGFRGETTFLAVLLAVFGEGVFVATFCNFFGVGKRFFKLSQKIWYV